jgi:transcriptional regulator with XRE-family HTH domain
MKPKVKFKIKELLNEKKISVARLARLADLNPATVYKLANNENPEEFSGHALVKIAAALNLPNVKDLFDDITREAA